MAWRNCIEERHRLMGSRAPPLDAAGSGRGSKWADRPVRPPPSIRVVSEAIETADTLFKRKQIALSVTMPEIALRVFGDPVRLS